MSSKMKANLFLFTSAIIISIVAVFNFVTKKTDFWEISFYQVVSLLFAIIITYFLTQGLNDSRRRVDKMDYLLTEIQCLSNRDDLLLYENGRKRSLSLLYQRLLSNKIECLKLYNCKDIEDDVKYIASQCEELKEFFGNHMQDENYMKKSFAEFQKYIVNINQKCDEVRAKLYCI